MLLLLSYVDVVDAQLGEHYDFFWLRWDVYTEYFLIICFHIRKFHTSECETVQNLKIMQTPITPLTLPPSEIQNTQDIYIALLKSHLTHIQIIYLGGERTAVARLHNIFRERKVR